MVNEDPASGVLFQAGKGTYLYIYERAATKAEHTVASFYVDDVETMVKELQAKGVIFEYIELPSLGVTTVDGVATMGEMKAAWFKDTEGNILGISNM